VKVKINVYRPETVGVMAPVHSAANLEEEEEWKKEGVRLSTRKKGDQNTHDVRLTPGGTGEVVER